MCISIQPTRPSRTSIALPPPLRLVAGLYCVLPEAAAVVDRPKRLAQLLLAHPLEHDAAAEQHLAEAGALLLEEGDELQRQVEPELGIQPADLECGDDAHCPVVLAAVAVRVAMGADGEDLLAARPVARDERPHRVLVDLEADLAELAGEVVERVPVVLRVRVAADRLVRERVVRACERLDVALDPLRAAREVDGHALSSHAPSLISAPVEDEHEDEWPPPAARYRSALWRAEGHLERGEWDQAAATLDDVLGVGDDELVRGMRHLAAAGYRARDGDRERAVKQLAHARRRLQPYLPEQEEVDLAALIEVVRLAVES